MCIPQPHLGARVVTPKGRPCGILRWRGEGVLVLIGTGGIRHHCNGASPRTIACDVDRSNRVLAPSTCQSCRMCGAADRPRGGEGRPPLACVLAAG